MTDREPESRTIEQLKEEFNVLNERKIKTQTQLDEANNQLKKLQDEAVAEFETSDIKELEAKLKQMQEENERRRREYQQLLDSISADLKKIESESESNDTPSGNADD
jgi:predicted  nucleic acid-binding Zn-ribbon protein